jgi:hypothetical protein
VRDRFKDAALSRAGIPLLRVKVKRSYSIPEIRGSLLEVLRDRS